MDNKIEKIEYRGYEINTFYDDLLMDEPNDWIDDGYLIYDHRDLKIAPSHKKPSFANDIFTIWLSGKEEVVEIDEEDCYVFPVYAYIHSGVALYLSKRTAMNYDPTGFDVSMKGFVVIKKSDNLSNQHDAYERAHALIKSYNIYLSGEVYGYTSNISSCWGFYGEEGYNEMITEAKKEIDYEIDKRRKEHYNKLKNYIKKRVPIIYRKPSETYDK